MTSNIIIKLTLVFLLFTGLQGYTIAQTPSLGPAVNTTTKSQQTAKAKQQARSGTMTGNQGATRANAAANLAQKNTIKTVYGYLYQDKEGIVILDSGEGQLPVMRKDTRTAYKSIIAALNHLSNEQKWRVMHNYDVTNSNPRPAFLLIKQVREE